MGEKMLCPDRRNWISKSFSVIKSISEKKINEIQWFVSMHYNVYCVSNEYDRVRMTGKDRNDVTVSVK